MSFRSLLVSPYHDSLSVEATNRLIVNGGGLLNNENTEACKSIGQEGKQIEDETTTFFQPDNNDVINDRRYENNNTGVTEKNNDDETKVLYRVSTETDEYIKVTISQGRVVGCLILGESDLEETMENIILSRINVDNLPFDLLDEHVDLEDYFD